MILLHINKSHIYVKSEGQFLTLRYSHEDPHGILSPADSSHMCVRADLSPDFTLLGKTGQILFPSLPPDDPCYFVRV